MSESVPRGKRDILRLPFISILVYGIPTLAVIATAILDESWNLLTLLWPLSFLTMGGACLLNALRCGRIHCWFTGPFFLLLAAASLLHGMHFVPLGPNGWRHLLGLFGMGAPALYLIPEWIWGRYFHRSS